MSWFYVAYELHDGEQNYESLWVELSELEAMLVLPSVWFVRAKHRARIQDLTDSLKRHLGPDDRLLVIECVDCLWQNLISNPLSSLFDRRSHAKENPFTPQSRPASVDGVPEPDRSQSRIPPTAKKTTTR
jgi:hypothetical protein